MGGVLHHDAIMIAQEADTKARISSGDASGGFVRIAVFLCCLVVLNIRTHGPAVKPEGHPKGGTPNTESLGRAGR